MPGTYLTPRAYNRRWWIDVSTNGTPEWAEIAKGISSRGNSISEQSQDYYDTVSYTHLDVYKRQRRRRRASWAAGNCAAAAFYCGS